MNLSQKNSKATYYRFKNNKIENFEPSFILELNYFSKIYSDSIIKEAIIKEYDKLIVDKPIKLKRQANLDIKTIQDRLLRGLFNRDKYQCFKLAHELMLRDKTKLFDILYRLSFIAEDENKLIKTYLFEYITQNSEYDYLILNNLIKYFISSCPKYMDMNDTKQIKYFESIITKLYILVYNKKCDEYGYDKINISGISELSYSKQVIYDILTKERE